MSEQQQPQLRLRVFAGPNGSGKSTIIKAIRETHIQDDLKLDVGIYINADDIAKCLTSNTFSFNPYNIVFDEAFLLDFANNSGLLSKDFTLKDFASSFQVKENHLKLIVKKNLDKVAQLLARYLRQAMIATKKRFSFETVFSNESNLDDMRRAKEAGYKVYLYFVGTESPEINKYRVALRVKEGGHSVPNNKIETRYQRSMELLYDAAEIAYQAFFFSTIPSIMHLISW